MLNLPLACLCCVLSFLSDDPTPMRPVDAAWREGLKLAPPRQADVILAELDALPGEDFSQPSTPEGWRDLQKRNEVISRRRVSLISELEESGYQGPRLQEHLRLKLQDLAKVAQSQQGGLNEPLYHMIELRDRHKGEPIGARAQIYLYARTFTQMRRAGLRVSAEDLPQIAEAELLIAKDPLETEAGSLLMNALQDHPQPVKDQWIAWAKEHLPPTSQIHREEARRNAFDKPIRLQGPTLDGGQVDTDEWRGSVILVDFWGSWCGPCKQVMPEIEALLAKHQSKGFRVIGILVDQPERARQYLKTTTFSWPHIIDSSAADSKESIPAHRIATQYAINIFPTVWLIDREGVLRKAPPAHDKEKLEAMIVKLLEQPAPPARPDPTAPKTPATIR